MKRILCRKLSLIALHLPLAVSISCTLWAGDAKLLFNGKDLTGWRPATGKQSTWKMGTAALNPSDPTKLVVKPGGTDLVVEDKGVNLYTTEEFTDCVLELEFMLSKGSNSGIKMMNLYEIQLFDSYGKPVVTATDCGAVYKESPPKVNACRKPGEWQQLLIDFRAPRFNSDGKKVAHAKFVKVVHNGEIIQENFEIAHGTNVPKTTPEHPRAGLFLQGDHGPVAFRNVRITRLD